MLHVDKEMEGERERSSSYLIICKLVILAFGLYVALPRQLIHKRSIHGTF
jgi:hypothetical protein